MNLAAFFNTALGNAVKVAIYQAASVALTSYALGGLTAEEITVAALVAGANSLLVFLKGAVNPTTPTLPGSSVAPSVDAPQAPQSSKKK